MSAGWGRLSSAILVQDWDTALEELNKLRKNIDDSVSHLSPPFYSISFFNTEYFFLCTHAARFGLTQTAAAGLVDTLESFCVLQPPQGTR